MISAIFLYFASFRLPFIGTTANWIAIPEVISAPVYAAEGEKAAAAGSLEQQGDFGPAAIRGQPAIPSFLAERDCRIHAAIFSFWPGVMQPMPKFGRSLV